MKIKCGNQKLEAYPVEPFVYEVVANGKKEFYQSAWDVCGSKLYIKNADAKIIKIPVVPMSDEEIDSEKLYFELGKKRRYPSEIEKFTNDKPKKKITFFQIMEVLAIMTWICAIISWMYALFM